MPNASIPVLATGLPSFTAISPSRRHFLHGLRQLAALPLIGGAVTILGSPTRAAVPVTDELLLTYSTWLEFERRYLHFEMDPHNERRLNDFIDMRNPAAMFHHVDFGDQDRDRERPSTRAALVLNAVGCSPREAHHG